MKPMLAVDHDPNKLTFPLYASPKLDGLRGLVHEGKLLSRSLKSIPNLFVQSILANPMFNGFDGELIAGSPTAENCMQACTSFFMASNKIQEFTFYIFDLHDCPLGFKDRYDLLKGYLEKMSGYCGKVRIKHNVKIVLHDQVLINNEDELLAYEAKCLDQGYEGLILRKIDGEYKYGRSTVNEGLLLKVKRFVDSEAVILGFEEQMENTNEKTVNELGRSKRSSHKAGKVGKDTLGALFVKDVHSGVEFNIGTGLDDATRRHIWDTRIEHINKIVKYKSFPVGVKDAPRHPVFLGFRDKRDMS
jgi:DNA ligase-1